MRKIFAVNSIKGAQFYKNKSLSVHGIAAADVAAPRRGRHSTRHSRSTCHSRIRSPIINSMCLTLIHSVQLGKDPATRIRNKRHASMSDLMRSPSPAPSPSSGGGGQSQGQDREKGRAAAGGGGGGGGGVGGPTYPPEMSATAAGRVQPEDARYTAEAAEHAKSAAGGTSPSHAHTHTHTPSPPPT